MPLKYEKREGVAYITLDSPDKANILDKKMSDDISEASRGRTVGGPRCPVRDPDRLQQQALLRRT